MPETLSDGRLRSGTGAARRDHTPPARDGALGEITAVAAALGNERLARDAAGLAERVAEGRFFVACIGQFKRGKSTLLNALVDTPVLPTGIVPVTAVPTVLRYGPALGAEVRLARADDRSSANGWRSIAIGELARYVSEAHNPENRLGVEAVQVFVPSPLLAGGLCLVDTPGLGSVFAGNSEATRAFVPHIDAALVLVGVDPPLAGEEVALVEAVAAQAPPNGRPLDLLLVLSKADRFPEAERAEAAAFAAQVLGARLGRPVERIYQVSATERLTGGGPPRDWPALVAALGQMQAAAGGVLVHDAHARGVARLAGECRRDLAEQRAALTRPVAESERRLAALRVLVHDAAQRALELGHLLAAEQQRLGRQFAARRADFLAATVPEATRELQAAIAALPRQSGPALRAAAYRLARAVGRRQVQPWLAGEQAEAERAYPAAMARFIALADQFLVDAARSGEGALAVGALGAEQAGSLRIPSRYYFREVLPLTYATPLRSLADLLRPPGSTRRVVTEAATRYLVDLLGMNSTLVENDLDTRVQESRLRLEAELQAALREVYLGVERALTRAQAAHAAGAAAVQEAVAHLDALDARLDATAG